MNRYSNEYLNYKFDKYVHQAKTVMMIDELQTTISRVEQYLRDNDERINRMTIAQRVHERRSQENSKCNLTGTGTSTH